MIDRRAETAVLIALPELAAYTDRWRSSSPPADWRTSAEQPGTAAEGLQGVGLSLSEGVAREGVGPSLSDRVPPHITVLVPWAHAGDAAFQSALVRLAEAVDGTGPLDLTFPSVDAFDEGAVWLRPEPGPEVLRLVRRVIRAFPEFPPYGGLHPDPQPHVTVSSSGGPEVVEDLRAAVAEAPPPSVRVEALTVWQEDPVTGIWHRLESVAL